jgi:hypothetical protein
MPAVVGGIKISSELSVEGELANGHTRSNAAFLDIREGDP